MSALADVIGLHQGQTASGTPRIPNRFHFVGGLTRLSRSFPLASYLCLASCLDVNRPEVVYFHYRYEPTGYYWEQIKDRIVPVWINAAPPTSYMAELAPSMNPDVIARRLDFIRLWLLLD